MAAQVKVSWDPRPAEEQVSGYRVFVDDVAAPDVTVPEATMEIEPGRHKFEVAPLCAWGVGPLSDPVYTPALPGKCVNVQLSISINITI